MRFGAAMMALLAAAITALSYTRLLTPFHPPGAAATAPRAPHARAMDGANHDWATQTMSARNTQHVNAETRTANAETWIDPFGVPQQTARVAQSISPFGVPQQADPFKTHSHARPSTDDSNFHWATRRGGVRQFSLGNMTPRPAVQQVSYRARHTGDENEFNWATERGAHPQPCAESGGPPPRPRAESEETIFHWATKSGVPNPSPSQLKVGPHGETGSSTYRQGAPPTFTPLRRSPAASARARARAQTAETEDVFHWATKRGVPHQPVATARSDAVPARTSPGPPRASTAPRRSPVASERARARAATTKTEDVFHWATERGLPDRSVSTTPARASAEPRTAQAPSPTTAAQLHRPGARKSQRSPPPPAVDRSPVAVARARAKAAALTKPERSSEAAPCVPWGNDASENERNVLAERGAVDEGERSVEAERGREEAGAPSNERSLKHQRVPELASTVPQHSPPTTARGPAATEELDGELQQRGADFNWAMDNGMNTAAAPDLYRVDGLATLVDYLAPEMQAAALKWCQETDTPSVQVLVLAAQDEAFLAALGVKPKGNTETMLRARLAAVRYAIVDEEVQSKKRKLVGMAEAGGAGRAGKAAEVGESKQLATMGGVEKQVAADVLSSAATDAARSTSRPSPKASPKSSSRSSSKVKTRKQARMTPTAAPKLSANKLLGR